MKKLDSLNNIPLDTLLRVSYKNYPEIKAFILFKGPCGLGCCFKYKKIAVINTDKNIIDRVHPQNEREIPLPDIEEIGLSIGRPGTPWDTFDNVWLAEPQEMY